MLRLNIGCGPYKKSGYVNIDKNSIWNPDIVMDVRKEFPYKDNSIDEIWASHFIEHLDKDEIIAFMHLCYLKLKTNGMLNIKFPTGVTYDLDHKSFLEKRSFEIFFRGGNDDYYFGPKISFKLISEKRTQNNQCKMLQLTMCKR